MKRSTISNLNKLHQRIKHNFLNRFIGFIRNENIDKQFEKLIEFRTEPREVNEFGLIGVSGGTAAGGGGGRELREEREEEGVKRENRFEDVVRWRRRGDEGEKEREVVDV